MLGVSRRVQTGPVMVVHSLSARARGERSLMIFMFTMMLTDERHLSNPSLRWLQGQKLLEAVLSSACLFFCRSVHMSAASLAW